jgi:pimeloyl-ACP methyl ester carboxylesterase
VKPTTPVEDVVVRVGPTRVRVRIAGSGPPLLMIMGIGANLEMWQPLEAALPGRQLIMFDFPGTGGSSLGWWPPTMGHNALFTRLLLRRLGYGRVDVLGYSWGGLVAQHLAMQHPKSVRRLVLAATTFGLGAVPPSARVATRMLTPQRYYSRANFARVAPSIYGGRFRTDATLVDAEIRRRAGHPPSVLGYAAQLLALTGYSSLPGLPLIGAPTLILAGDDDPLVASLNPQVLARFIRRSTLRVIPEAGHLLLLDSSAVLAPIIEGFLGEAAEINCEPKRG